MFGRAAEEARRLRQNWVGPEHCLLAVLAEPSVATAAMAELGVTHERVETQLVRLKRAVRGARVRYVRSKGVTANPAAHDVRGWAQGFAAASGRMSPTPGDWLLSFAYHNDGMVGTVLHELGVPAVAVVEGLRRQGLETPDHAPPEFHPGQGHRSTEVARSEWKAVVALLHEMHPPGSPWRWGFNSRKDRPGRIQFTAEDGVELAAIVAEARARRSKTRRIGGEPG